MGFQSRTCFDHFGGVFVKCGVGVVVGDCFEFSCDDESEDGREESFRSELSAEQSSNGDPDPLARGATTLPLVRCMS